MTINEIKYVLLWCTGLNYAVLFIWFGVFIFAHGWMCRMHGRWFKLSVETFDTIHYAGLAVYKIGILLFNLAPLIALHLVSRLSHERHLIGKSGWIFYQAHIAKNIIITDTPKYLRNNNNYAAGTDRLIQRRPSL